MDLGKIRTRWAAGFIGGFLLGIALVYIKKGAFILQTDFLGKETIMRMKNLSFDYTALFLYCLKQRFFLGSTLFLAALAGIGGFAVLAALLWSGFSFGVVLSVLSVRYGLKGILLFLAGSFPQALLLVPAFYMLAKWCVKNGKVQTVLRISVVVIIGCLLESYVNPFLLKVVLKIF